MKYKLNFILLSFDKWNKKGPHFMVALRWVFLIKNYNMQLETQLQQLSPIVDKVFEFFYTRFIAF